MSRARPFSLEEVMNFTLQDVLNRNLTDMRIDGWADLSPDVREECIGKLRDLLRQRDEQDKSVAVDATELEAKLMEIQRCSSSPTPPFDPEEHDRTKADLEIGLSKTLIEAHGRPCYPVELAPEIYRDLGVYKDITEYWDTGLYCTPIGKQLRRWKEFRQFQQRNRSYFVPRARFPEFQQRVIDRRRRHGLDGNVRLRLHEDHEKQSDLDHWMEYQDYELQRYEKLQRDLENAQAALVARRKAVAEAGLTAYEDVQDLEFGGYFGLSFAHRSEEGPVIRKVIATEERLELAESRLKAARSDDLGDFVTRGVWTHWFQEQIHTAQAQSDAVPVSHDDDWWLPEGKYYIHEAKDKRERSEKTRAAQKKIRDARTEAREALTLAREGFEAAQADDFAEGIERTALVDMILGEVQSARAQVDEAQTALDHVQLKGKVIAALGSIVHANLEIKKHRVLLGWIESQRSEMTNGSTSPKRADQPHRSEPRALRSRLKAGRSTLNSASKANHQRTLPSTQPSSLKPTSTSRITKQCDKRRTPQQKMKRSDVALQPANKVPTVSAVPKPRENGTTKATYDVSTLRSVHSSRVVKSKEKTRPRKPGNLATLSGRSGLMPSSMKPNVKKVRQNSASAALRRGTRIRKRPERFYPG